LAWGGRRCARWVGSTHSNVAAAYVSAGTIIMFVQTQQLWMWHQAYQHHEQLPMAFGGRWPSWNSDLDNRPW